MIKQFTRGLIATAALGAMALSPLATAQDVSIGTMSQGTSGYAMGASIARILADNGIQARVQPAAGTSAYLPLISMGELDFGIANAIESSEATAGEGAFEGHKLDGLRAIAVMYPFRVGIFVRDDSGIETIAELKGKRIAHGYTSQVTLRKVLNALLATGGLTEDDINPIMVPNVVRGADTFAAGRSDAAFFAVGSGKVSEMDASVGGLHFLPVPNTPKALAAMKAIVPEAYIGTIRPGPNVAGVDEPMPGMMYDYMLLAGAHVPNDVIEKVVKILHENKKALVAGFGGFNGFNPDKMVNDLPVKWHEGAIAAYKDLGQWPPKQ